ncbi:hypothetical protein C8R44DRAFT_928576 [Mycena epipterygia]|nr:hypothetical protein C8R44DRAFT_928576 [Mycena epipterygia]
MVLKIIHWRDDGPAAMTAFGSAPHLRDAEIHRDSVSAVWISIPWTLELKHHVDKRMAFLKLVPNLEILAAYVSSYFEQLARVPVTLAGSTLSTYHLTTIPPHSSTITLPAAIGMLHSKLYMIRMTSDAAYKCINNMDSIRDLTTRYLAASNDELTTLVEAMAERIYPLPALQSLNLDWYSMGIPEYPLAEMLAARWAGIEGAATITPFRLSQAHLEADIAHTLAQLPNLRPKD